VARASCGRRSPGPVACRSFRPALTLWSSAQRLAVALAVAAAGVAPPPGDAAEGATAARAAQAERELTVMTFNVWYGGVQVDFRQVARSIRAAGADVVGVQEPEGNLHRLATVAGLPYVDESLHMISRYPLFAVEREGVRLAYAALDLDHVVALGNVHLTCCPYGPEEAGAGKSAEEVLELERSLRLPEIRPYLRSLRPLAGRGVPTFLTGDFNSPSHLDWTEAVARARPQRVPYPLVWPVSTALARAGFRDSYREAHPDPVATPGFTWTPGTPPPRTRRRETLDRIDWVLAAGPARTLAARLVGETGGPDVEVGVQGYGSDHRAMASTFAVSPATAPPLVSAEPRVVTRGRRVSVRYTRTAGGPGRQIGILRGSSRRPVMSIPIFDGADHLAAYFGTAPLSPGAYRAALLRGDGGVAATYRFWVEAPGTRPSIRTARRSYRRGRPIRLSWKGAPANKLDWIGIYAAGESDLYQYLGFKYTGARPSGRMSFTRADLGALRPGRYRATLMLDDGYSVLAQARFRVR
jgi:endonuclease/exonuclease/phosphatase family metal-dependent hydrolase